MLSEVKTKRFISCPNCGEGEHTVEHLFNDPWSRTAGPWSCDFCNHEFCLTPLEGGQIKITDLKEKENDPQVVCLFRLGNLYVVSGPYRVGPDDEYDYFFHSHQCPSNIFRNTRAVYAPDYGEDPHGVFRFVASIPLSEIEDDRFGGGDTLESLFRTFKTDGRDAPTQWPEADHGVIPWVAEMQRQHEKDTSPKA